MSRRSRSLPSAGTPESAPRIRPKARELTGSSPLMMRLRERIARIAKSRLPVLIYGATGTGKELVARALHELSPRAGAAFLPVNCATLSLSMADAQLFGHVRGAFTGAEVDRSGYFQAAHQGTLFLDELGELPREIQPKLLRAVQEGAVVAVGDSFEQEVDVQVIAATNVDLGDASSFRPDLYHRLAAHVVTVPSLDERRSDIPEILDATLGARSEGYSACAGAHWRARFTGCGLAALMSRLYPGNVRELLLLTESALIEVDGDIDAIALEEVANARSFGRPREASKVAPAPARRSDLGAELRGLISALPAPARFVELRRLALRSARDTQGSERAAAKFLGLSSTTYARWLRRSTG